MLIAADCTAFAYADFHRGFMRGRITLIGCPKLDGVDYSQKLEAVFADNDIASVTVARMEVPCCGGLEHARRARAQRQEAVRGGGDLDEGRCWSAASGEAAIRRGRGRPKIFRRRSPPYRCFT